MTLFTVILALFLLAALALAARDFADEGHLVGLLLSVVAVVAFYVAVACLYESASRPVPPRTETVTVEKVGEDGKVVVVHDTRYVPVYGWYHPWYWYCGPYGYYAPYVVYHDHYHYGSSGIYRNVPANRVVTVNKTVNVNHNHVHAAAPQGGKPAAKPATAAKPVTQVKPVVAPKVNSNFKPAAPRGGSRGRR